jgi:hypothetical protein
LIEVYLRIDGRMVYLWRAVDAEGEVLDVLIQSKRDKHAALKAGQGRESLRATSMFDLCSIECKGIFDNRIPTMNPTGRLKPAFPVTAIHELTRQFSAGWGRIEEFPCTFPANREFRCRRPVSQDWVRRQLIQDCCQAPAGGVRIGRFYQTVHGAGGYADAAH